MPNGERCRESRIPPGLFMQRFTTVEPEDGMIEVAIAAIQRVIPEGEDEDRW